MGRTGSVVPIVREAAVCGWCAGRHRRGLLALGPAHALAAQLLERQIRVERHRVDDLLPRHPAVQDLGVESDAGGDVGQHRPSRAHLAGMGDRGAQALDAPVGVGDRALLLGVRLGGEDHVGVLGQALGQHRGVRHHHPDLVQGALPQGAVGELADRVGLERGTAR